MRPIRLAVAGCLLGVSLVACSDDSTTQAGVTPAATEDATVSTTTAPTAGSASGSQDEVTTLEAFVGTPDEPDAFEIGIRDAEGDAVESLPAGTYRIEVSDLSDIHNFHLIGPGGVDEQTSVGEVEDVVWEVELSPGNYEFLCDPHPFNMKGFFAVT